MTITSAPVVPGASAEVEEDAASDGRLERGAARRAQSRKLVTYVIAGAAAVVLLGILRVLLSGHDSSKDAGPQTTASAEAVVVTRSPGPAPAHPDEPGAEPTNPLPSPAAGTARALPTSEPSLVKKPGPKRKPFRPTGI